MAPDPNVYAHTIFILEADSEGVIILLAAIHVSPLEARRFFESLSSVNRMGKGCMYKDMLMHSSDITKQVNNALRSMVP